MMKKLAILASLFLSSLVVAAEKAESSNFIVLKFPDNQEIKLDKKYVPLSKTLSSLYVLPFQEAKSNEIEISVFSKQEIEQVISLLPPLHQVIQDGFMPNLNLVVESMKTFSQKLGKKTNLELGKVCEIAQFLEINDLLKVVIEFKLERLRSNIDQYFAYKSIADIFGITNQDLVLAITENYFYRNQNLSMPNDALISTIKVADFLGIINMRDSFLDELGKRLTSNTEHYLVDDQYNPLHNISLSLPLEKLLADRCIKHYDKNIEELVRISNLKYAKNDWYPTTLAQALSMNYITYLAYFNPSVIDAKKPNLKRAF